MRELQRKQNMRRTLYSAPSLLVLLIITFVLAKGAWGVISKERLSAMYLDGLEDKSLALALREEELQGDIGRLKTEEGIKEEIKERFNVTEEGEHVAVLVDNKTATSSSTSGKPWYKKLWSAIMNTNQHE